VVITSSLKKVRAIGTLANESVNSMFAGRIKVVFKNSLIMKACPKCGNIFVGLLRGRAMMKEGNLWHKG
jgi:hypothetical protein